jgi:hypothetical protein
MEPDAIAKLLLSQVRELQNKTFYIFHFLSVIFHFFIFPLPPYLSARRFSLTAKLLVFWQTLSSSDFQKET